MRRFLALGIVGVLLAGCGTAADQAQRMALAALNAPAAQAVTTSTPAVRCSNAGVEASLRPPATMPAPGAMPAGSFMATIQRRGYLKVGVDQNTLLLAYFNPLHGGIEGFEIDLAQDLARAIFGDTQNRVHLIAITTDERISAVRSGAVDIVIDAMTITCARKLLVDFSTVYYRAVQRLLMPRNALAANVVAKGVGQLAGHKVCATKGSTSIENLASFVPGAIPYPVDQRTDCLVALQENQVAAITSDDAILLGFEAQDPYTSIVGPDGRAQPYGMAIAQSHPDFVRFVNGWLAQIRAKGTWRRIYHAWFGKFSATPAPPVARYAG
jgi:polar amino acid transport system substrate-binding protein